MSEKLNTKRVVLGLMSGTSLDGLDLALCRFGEENGNYSFEILKAATMNYTPEWKNTLAQVKDASAERYFELHTRYGEFIAGEVNEFLKDCSVQPSVIASHGHTVFHQPEKGFTTQIGSGAAIAALTGITTVCDFRSLDVANGGQGAPLVPVGDQFLFSQYDACLNLGGIANISLNNAAGHRIAYDICEANLLLNYLAEKKGKAFDENGGVAKSGTADAVMLDQLNNLPFYKLSGAKSLGREWFEKTVQPLFETAGLSVEDQMATAVEHIATVIAADLAQHKIKTVLVTGGGAFNTFLIEHLRKRTKTELIIPDAQIVNFKEAMVFAFLGYLRMEGKVNTLKSVTGAKRDGVGGAIYFMEDIEGMEM